MNVVVERLIELNILKRHRKLNDSETRELDESIRYLEKLEWKRANLKNLSLIASMTNDAEWQHEICSELENLY